MSSGYRYILPAEPSVRPEKRTAEDQDQEEGKPKRTKENKEAHVSEIPKAPNSEAEMIEEMIDQPSVSSLSGTAKAHNGDVG